MSKRIRGIEEGQHVQLLMGDLEGVDARVEELADSHAVVGLFREPSPSLEQIGEIEGVIEAAGPRGLARLVGTMKQHGRQADAVVLRFDQGPEVIQRRQFVRIDTTTTVTVTRDNGDRHKTFTLNLSGAGLLLGGPEEVAVDEQIKLDIDVGEDDPPIHARGRVVRETREHHKGIQIDMIEEGDRDRLIKFVFEKQRLAPRVRG